jgi:hypothetical protein
VSHTIMVRVSDLNRLPEPVRRYFDDWGFRATVLGVKVVRVDMMIRFDHVDWVRKKQGRGPGHTVDNRAYLVGGRSINEWIEKHPKLVDSFYGEKERSEYIDDD